VGWFACPCWAWAGDPSGTDDAIAWGCWWYWDCCIPGFWVYCISAIAYRLLLLLHLELDAKTKERERRGIGAAKVQTDEEGKVQDMISNSAKTKTEFALFWGEKKTEGKQSAARLRQFATPKWQQEMELESDGISSEVRTERASERRTPSSRASRGRAGPGRAGGRASGAALSESQSLARVCFPFVSFFLIQFSIYPPKSKRLG
jgi:hypothetical protein